MARALEKIAAAKPDLERPALRFFAGVGSGVVNDGSRGRFEEDGA